MNKASVIAAMLLMTTQIFAEANDKVLMFESGAEQVALIELYTSEGCHSCPPADRWLSTLKSDDGLWQEFVPVAFHVDYWDYIGLSLIHI